MERYWRLTLLFFAFSLILFGVLNLSISLDLRSPNLIESITIEDIKTIYELNESLNDLHNTGKVYITEPELRVGGGFEVKFNFLNRSTRYYMQHDRLLYSEYINNERTVFEFVKVDEKKSERISRKLRYLWNQIKKEVG